MRATLISLALGALSLAACAAPPSIYADNQPAEAHDIRVYTADHLVIDGQELTLADAEAPKPGGKADCEAEGVAGAQAVTAVRSILAGARHIEVQKTDDASGRRLVNVDGLDLGQTLIAQKLAVARRDDGMDWCARAARDPQRFAAVETTPAS